MPVSSSHPAYTENSDMWTTCRDCYMGSRHIKAKKQRYLPQLEGQSTADYHDYRLRATFFPIVAKTVGALVGLATYKPATVSHPTDLDDIFVDAMGAQFKELLSDSLEEIILMGRYALLVDAPLDGGDPYLVPYTAESIINWWVDDFGRLSWVILKEVKEVPSPKDPYILERVVQYRKLYLDQLGLYTQEVYDAKNALVSRVTPMFDQGRLDYIPIVIMGTTGVHVSVDKSPMEDIAALNVSHYQTSADLEWGRHFTGLPTPVVSGVDSTSKLKIGGRSAWILPEPTAKAYFLEFTGQGLGSLEKALQEKQGQMATMSARMIDQSSRGSEAAETVRLRYLSEMAGLTEIVHSVEQGLNLAYNILAKCRGAAENVLIELSRDFMATKLAAADITALFKAYFEGGISKESLVYNLRRGEMLDPKRTDEEELAAIREPEPRTDKKPEGALNAD